MTSTIKPCPICHKASTYFEHSGHKSGCEHMYNGQLRDRFKQDFQGIEEVSEDKLKALVDKHR